MALNMKDLKKEIDVVMAETKDKYLVRTAVTMELTKKEFIMFLISRYFIKDYFVKKTSNADNLDTRFFKSMFMTGVKKTAKTVSLVSLESMLKDIRKDLNRNDDDEWDL